MMIRKLDNIYPSRTPHIEGATYTGVRSITLFHHKKGIDPDSIADPLIRAWKEALDKVDHSHVECPPSAEVFVGSTFGRPVGNEQITSVYLMLDICHKESMDPEEAARPFVKAVERTIEAERDGSGYPSRVLKTDISTRLEDEKQDDGEC